jgi:hypothetical protein
MQPDTLVPEQAREQLETAQREATEARDLVDELAERVRDGDTDVTAEQMAGQKQLAELAELRVTAAERKLAEAVRVDLDARARATSDRIRALVDDDSTAPILDAARAVTAAVNRLLTVSAERHDTIRRVAIEGAALNEELGRTQDDPWPCRAYGFMAQATPPSVTAEGHGGAGALSAGQVLGLVLYAAVRDEPKLYQHVTEALSGTRAGFEHRAAEISGLAEVLAETTEGNASTA